MVDPCDPGRMLTQLTRTVARGEDEATAARSASVALPASISACACRAASETLSGHNGIR
jgi:hypothetical protein